MFQPAVKLEFVQRYCHPQNGWTVFVDIDASEEGRTGGKRITNEAKQRQQQMEDDAVRVRRAFANLGVTVGGKRSEWFDQHALPKIEGDRDIIAFHQERKICLVAEVEGASSGQPEQNLYKAIGQAIIASSSEAPPFWNQFFVVVVYGQAMSNHLQRASALGKLGIARLSIADKLQEDSWFSDMTLPKLLSGILGDGVTNNLAQKAG